MGWKAKAVWFVIGAIYFYVYASVTKDFRWRNWDGGTPMPRWLGRTIGISLGVLALAMAILVMLGILH
jgi:hypothetical protein